MEKIKAQLKLMGIVLFTVLLVIQLLNAMFFCSMVVTCNTYILLFWGCVSLFIGLYSLLLLIEGLCIKKSIIIFLNSFVILFACDIYYYNTYEPDEGILFYDNVCRLKNN